MRENEFNVSPVRISEGYGQSGADAPIIAPTFVSNPPYCYSGNYGNNGNYGNGIGLEAILLATLFGNRGFGNHGDCNGKNDLSTSIFGTNILSKLGSIEGAIPLSALQTQNSILEQTASITNQINQVGLAQLQATTNVKDSVQNGTTAILLNDNNNTKDILGAICNLSSKIDQNRISELETQLASQRFDSRSRDVEINVTQQVNQAQVQAQAQQQQQTQFAQLFQLFNHLAGDIQAVKQGQVIFNSGTMAGSGSQGAANTKVGN